MTDLIYHLTRTPPGVVAKTDVLEKGSGRLLGPAGWVRRSEHAGL